jgi:hypothetical protein
MRNSPFPFFSYFELKLKPYFWLNFDNCLYLVLKSLQNRSLSFFFVVSPLFLEIRKINIKSVKEEALGPD